MTALTAGALDEQAELLRALAHPMRLAILLSLGAGERSVGVIAERTGLVQPTLSQQLSLLRKADLVRARREAKQVFYSVDAARLDAVRAMLDHIAPGAGVLSVQPVTSARPDPAKLGAAVFARVRPDGQA